MTGHDLVISRGRVIDPETGLDAVRDIGVSGGTIREVSAEPLAGEARIDATGLTVCPGFVDLHSHSADVAGHRLQALDGVTTVLELEAGSLPVSAAYRAAAEEGRPLNYGFATSWAMARMAVLAGVEPTGRLETLFANIAVDAWQRPASPGQVARIVGLLERDLADGALGIGVLVGYAPRTGPEEYLAVAALAARAGRPTYTHARELVEMDAGTPVDGAEEIVRAAVETGAHMHYCHVNSTSIRHVDRVLGLVERVRAEGARVTTEAYPYGAGMTGVGAAFLAPELLHRRGLTPHSIGLLSTGRRMADAAELHRVRREEPGSAAFVHLLDEDSPAEFAYIRRALSFEDAAVATDAVPLLWRGGGDPARRLQWPLPPDTATHPRTAGTYGRTLRLVRERGMLGLAEAVRRCTLVPARVAGLPRKGRIQPGADADLTVFDPATVTDRATYAATALPSAGFRHVLVGGVPVVRDGDLLPDAFPGTPVRA
ncbi:amidohydrolase family protein [Nonomuraea sp. SBT364]|uniref:amidohydrolase family protein n=1 Tax=Nonomuraea sp. SBT364 TaxID=1580530 RepID=UPI00066BEB63|nr:amidohydrolase family protein [Nonomuraea sp. SBT364]